MDEHFRTAKYFFPAFLRNRNRAPEDLASGFADSRVEILRSPGFPSRLTFYTEE
jgi:hypothetical protein